MKAIVISGPESSGKTTLCKEISAYFRLPCVDEYARTYIGQLHRPYTYSDVEHIAAQQYATFLEMDKLHSGCVVFDTYLIVTRVWFTHCYGTMPDWIDEAIRSSAIAHVFLCEGDLPFEPDPLRENEHLRQYLFGKYFELLTHFQFPYTIVNGNGPQRFKSCIQKVQTFL